MKLLVFGRTGQVAQALAGASGRHTATATLVGRPDTDITNKASVADAVAGHKPDIVVNAAAYTQVDQAECEPDLAFAVNDMGAGHIAAACTRTGTPLIHLSTDYVFDGAKTGPYIETDPACPIGVYGESKLKGERQVSGRCPHHIILRTAWIYGPTGKNFVRTMLRLAGSRDDISVVNDQVGSPTYAPHLAQCILKIASQLYVDNSSTPWGLYHAAGGGAASWFDVAEETFSVSRQRAGPFANVTPIPSSEYPTPAKRPANSHLDCQKLNDTFSVKLPEWRQGIAECVSTLVAKSALADPL